MTTQKRIGRNTRNATPFVTWVKIQVSGEGKETPSPITPLQWCRPWCLGGSGWGYCVWKKSSWSSGVKGIRKNGVSCRFWRSTHKCSVQKKVYERCFMDIPRILLLWTNQNTDGKRWAFNTKIRFYCCIFLKKAFLEMRIHQKAQKVMYSYIFIGFYGNLLK